MNSPGERTGRRGWHPDAPARGRALPPELRDRFVAAAAHIGDRLVREAVWAEDACTWQLTRSDESAGAPAKPEPAPGVLYDGAAGIGLFLAELHHAGGTPGLRRTAAGAIEFALREAAGLPDTRFGFYTGRIGIAYAAVRAGSRLGLDLRARAEAVLRPLAGNEHLDHGLDVIAGAAGAIPALLWLSDHLDAELTAGMACRLGERLRDSAHRLPAGWCWGSVPAPGRPLCGVSHGASGMAHAFLELYHRTGDGAFRYAAEQALLYERGCFSPEHGNWPDFRNRELGRYFLEGRRAELRARLRAGDPPPRQPPSLPSFWCHGAPGIGLVRLRAYQVLGSAVYLEEARVALATTIDSLAREDLSYSLCHGVAGNCDTLLAAADLLGEEALRVQAGEWALRGIRRYEDTGLRWPCGTADGVPDPGLLLGEAGIGLFLLRLADPRVESVLLVTPPTARLRDAAAGDAGYQRARDQEVEEHFGRTLRRFREMGVEVDALAPPTKEGSALETAYAVIGARIEAEDDPPRRELLRDAFLADRARFELLRDATDDVTGEFLDSLGRPPLDQLDLDTVRFVLSPRTRVLESHVDWERDGPVANPRETRIVAHRAGASVRIHALAPLPSAVLHALCSPSSVEEVTTAVAELLGEGSDAAAREELRERVRQQLAMAYGSGLVMEARIRG